MDKLSSRFWNRKYAGFGMFLMAFVTLFLSIIAINPRIAKADITTNLVGHWTFDTADTTWGVSSTTADISGSNNTGTLNRFYSATSTVSGPINEALYFDGATTTVTLSSTINLTGAFTASVWIYKRTGGEHVYFGSNNNSNYISTNFPGGSPYIIIRYQGSLTNVTLTSIPSLNVWHHLVLTRDGSNNLKAYLNGYDVTTGSPTYSETQPIDRIGERLLLSVFPGPIDDARIYNRALSPADITELYNLGLHQTVTTSAASSITGDSATLNADLTANVVASSTNRGFAYGTDSTLATVIATTTSPGTYGSGAFTEDITDLLGNTTYYFRAYALNATSTDYGTIESFATLNVVTAPSVTTVADSAVSTSTVTLHGNLAGTGGAEVTQHGFAYGTSANLSSSVSTTTLGSASVGAFEESLTALIASTTYYFRAYAVNSAGTSTGSILTFDTDLADDDLTTGLQAWWKFDEGSGTSADDSSPNTNTGTLTNSPTWTTGVDGGALSFDGTNDWVSVADSASLDMTHSSTTLSLWFMPADYWRGGDYNSPFTGKQYAYGLPAYGMTTNTVKSSPYHLFDSNITNATGTTLRGSAASLYPNKWYHLVSTFSDTGTSTWIRMYVDGQLVATRWSSLRVEDSDSLFRIGMQGGVYTTGRIDDVRVWNRSLSAGQINTLYTAFSAPANPTNDVTAPVITGGYPGGRLPANSHYVILNVDVDEVATCKYDTTADTAFASMSNTFETTLQLRQTSIIKGIEDGQEYTYYVKCQDIFGNTSNDYTIAFSTDPPYPAQSVPSVHTGDYWYVSTTGTAGGDGSIDDPWDIQTALMQPGSVSAGDTIWIRGGIYGTGGSTRYNSDLTGTSDNLITVRAYPGERPIIDGGLNEYGTYAQYWGLEFFNSTSTRLINRNVGGRASPNIYGTHVKVINTISHDMGHPGFGTWSEGGEMYGLILWGNGYYDYFQSQGGFPDVSSLSGSGMYTQNINSTKYLRDVVSFREFTTGFKTYAEGAHADYFHIEGNTLFNNGQWNFESAGVDFPMTGFIFKNNRIYRDDDDSAYGKYGPSFGYYSIDQVDATIEDNYFVGGGFESALSVNDWSTLTFSGNTVISNVASAVAPVVKYLQPATLNSVTWDNNTYFSNGSTDLFAVDTVTKTLAQVRSELGIDTNSTYTASLPTTNYIDVRPNLYEPGDRAHIVVYNWENLESDEIDVSTVGMTNGDYFEVYDIQNLLGEPVYRGVYDGSAITLPLNLSTTTPLIGTITHLKLAHTDPVFNTFLLKTVPIVPPAMSTQDESSVTATAATLNGTITDIMGSYPSQHGFVWGTSSTLATAATTTLGARTTTGAFTSDLTGLTCNTTYYFRSYATNDAGVGYGSIVSFTTSACPEGDPEPEPTVAPASSSNSSGGTRHDLVQLPDGSWIPRNSVQTSSIQTLGSSPLSGITAVPSYYSAISYPSDTSSPSTSDISSGSSPNSVLSPIYTPPSILTTLPSEFLDLIRKFPSLGKTLSNIAVRSGEDVLDTLKSAKLSLPNLSRESNTTGIPISSLTPLQKQSLPEEVIFARSGDLIDYNVSLTVSDEGTAEQVIHTIAGKPIDLALKPDKPVKSITGYLTIKNIKRNQAMRAIPANSMLTASIGSLLAQNTEEAPVVDEKLVLTKFSYSDTDKDGIYTASITAPMIHGEYDIMTIMEYKDDKLGAKEFHLTTVVDPEGYVYHMTGDEKTRIHDAKVTIYVKDPKTGQFAVWPADKYKQVNPQITDDTGMYSFLVPEGTYKLTVSAPRYRDYAGSEFQVLQGSGIHENIELKKKGFLSSILGFFARIF